MSFTIAVRKVLQHHPLVGLLLKNRNLVEFVEASECFYDFYRSGCVILLCEGFNHITEREVILKRIKSATCSRVTKKVYLIFLCHPDEELGNDFLTWANLVCGIDQGCGVLFAWSLVEASALINSLLLSTRDHAFQPNRVNTDSAPLPIFVDTFTQTPQILSRLDVIRVCNTKKTVADFLSSTSESIENIAGIGVKKGNRLSTLLNTPFIENTINVKNVLVANDEKKAEETTQTTSALAKALDKFRDSEDVRMAENLT